MRTIFHTTLLAAFLTVIALPVSAQMSAEATWNFDQTHSNIGFHVTHLVISEVDGQFKDFNGTVVTANDDFSDAKINFTIKTASIDTENEKRNGHLVSPEFFDAEKYPEITFVSKRFTKVEGNKYQLVGDLTMHGVTKEETLEVTYGGQIVDPWGQTKAGFKLRGELNRFDYGLKWDAATESGSLVVSREVELDINAQLVLAK